MLTARLLVSAVLGVTLASPSLRALTLGDDALAPPAPVPAPIAFDVPVQSMAPDGAVEVLSADVDGDGRLDLASITTGGDVYLALDPADASYTALNWQIAA